MSDSDSDYCVEEFVRPDKIAVKPVNDESADILGNFSDRKLKATKNDSAFHFEENPYADDDDEGEESNIDEEETDQVVTNNDADSDEAENDKSDSSIGDQDKTQTVDNPTSSTNASKESKKATIEQSVKKAKVDKTKPVTTKLTAEQVNTLLRGASKSNRFVLYVANLNFGTTKEALIDHFSLAGPVKSVRIPKVRRGGFAFVEMLDIKGFQSAFELHNSQLNGRQIKIQLSEGGKKKSANKKNILKQKNRKLAEMRNESIQFNRSGKNYDRNFRRAMAEKNPDGKFIRKRSKP